MVGLRRRVGVEEAQALPERVRVGIAATAVDLQAFFAATRRRLRSATSLATRR